MENNDDKIIAIAFRRSLLVLAAILVIALLWLVVDFREDEQPIDEAAPITPQPMTPSADRQPPSVQFTDITAAAGITHEHFNGAYGERLLPETMGGGVAVLDYNNDQRVDLLFVNGSQWPWRSNDPAATKTAALTSLILYRGDGNGGFEDVTAQADLDISLYGMGVAVADYDNDGHLDIFVTTVGHDRLFRNLDGERFEEVTDSAGVGGSAGTWSTGAAFVDYDKDGDLDLVVLNYVRWSREIDLQADYQLTGIGRAYGPPAQFAGTNSVLYQNNGDGTFSDVSSALGLQVINAATGQPVGKALSVLPTDIDADGWTDLVVANDTVRNFVFRNNAGQSFTEVGERSGLAFDNSGIATGAMGIDGTSAALAGDYAIAIGNFGNEMTSLYVRATGENLFTDQAIVSGVGPASRRAVTFGLFFFDYDLDGRADLLQANGHVENDINVVEPGQQYAQSPQLFWNCGLDCPRQFIPVKLAAGNGLAEPIVGRGAAYADIDRDGDLDVIMTQIGGPPRLLRNDQVSGHDWIQFEVLGANGLPAYRASVELMVSDAGQSAMRRSVVEPSRSYLSQVEPVVNFGLGTQAKVERVTINWPDGTSVQLDQPAVNQRHRISLPE